MKSRRLSYVFGFFREMLRQAQIGGYAIPAFNIHNLETIQAVVETAAEMASPVIFGRNTSTFSYAGTEYLVQICQQAARHYRMPFALHLDHHESYDDITQKVAAGIKSIMIDGSHFNFEAKYRADTSGGGVLPSLGWYCRSRTGASGRSGG